MIVNRQKTYEFRKKRYPITVQRFWFYETAPTSAITHICEVLPAHKRIGKPISNPLDRIGIDKYNQYHPNFKGYAYRVTSCYKIHQPIELEEMKEVYGFGAAPRGFVNLPEKLAKAVKWDEQECVWSDVTRSSATT